MYSQFRRFGILVLFLATACLGSPKTDAWNVLNEGLNGSAARRVQALSALGLLGQDEQAAHLARQAMRTKDPEVRQSAIAALGEMQCRDAIPQLKLALDDGNEQVGLAAAKALANMGDMSGRDIFKRLLTGEMKQG
ncbi:MAG: HEAT repeat domain-containing protein, partial [Rhodospirillales bacterium]|nr:HEAT repeat domain-containing protein [Rhodospirillales bacterium]